jgi:hypothetical protein
MTSQSPLPPTSIEELERIRVEAKGPFGPPSFRSLARSHVALFDELQGLGASWKQIGSLIAEYGVTGIDGRPISEAVLRATVSAERIANARATYGASSMASSGRGNKDHSKTQYFETHRSETQHWEVQRNEAMRNETIRNEVQQHRQHEAEQPKRSVANGGAPDAGRQAKIESLPRPSSDLFYRPTRNVEDNLLRRVERTQRFKED